MSRRAEAAADTRDRIVDAVLERFGSLPYDRIRLEDVAADAEVSLPTVLRHFGSKAGLVTAMATRELSRIADTREHRRGQPPARVVADLITHYERYGDLILKVYAESDQVDGLAEIGRTGRAYHVQWCEEAFAAALDHVGDEPRRRRRRAQLVALCDATTWRILRRDAGLEPGEVETALLELVLPLCAGDGETTGATCTPEAFRPSPR